MKLEALEVLHKSMLALATEAQPVETQYFQACLRRTQFNVLFSTLERPYTLALTCQGKTPILFLFTLEPGYQLSPMFHPAVYGRLCAALRANGGESSRLVPREFLSELNAQIPREASLAAVPSPPQLLALRPDVVEERDKPYFSHWRHPGARKQGFAQVSATNRQKTLVLLGTKALAYSQATNQSSSWSANPVKPRTAS